MVCISAHIITYKFLMDKMIPCDSNEQLVKRVENIEDYLMLDQMCPLANGDIVRKKLRKRRSFKKVQAFCEEKVLRYLLRVFWYAESKNQCWQAEKWRLHYLICIFPRWPPN